jgi:hypothetical protein
MAALFPLLNADGTESGGVADCNGARRWEVRCACAAVAGPVMDCYRCNHQVTDLGSLHSLGETFCGMRLPSVYEWFYFRLLSKVLHSVLC